MKSGNAVEYTIELSEEAYDDLVNIQNYTYTQFGEKQWQKYSALIDKAFAVLQEHTFVGHSRNDIPDGYQAWLVQKHVVIYRVEKTIVYVVRVLHGRMNFRYQF